MTRLILRNAYTCKREEIERENEHKTDMRRVSVAVHEQHEIMLPEGAFTCEVLRGLGCRRLA